MNLFLYNDTMRVAFIADEITSFIKDHDSTWSIMLAAHEAGDEVFYAHASSLYVSENQVMAHLIKLDKEFFDYQVNHESKLLKFPVLPLDENDSPEKYPCEPLSLDSMDLVFMRSDPPVDSDYITACQLLSLCKKAKVINRPQSLISFNEKLSILNFPELITDTLVSGSEKEIREFIAEHKKIAIKPLDGMAGAGVFVVELGDKNLGSIIEASLARSKTLMCQKYIPEISQGDKRIIMINGKAAGVLLRVPQETDHRANLAAGGTFVGYELTKRDEKICDDLKHFLIDNGIYLAGIDVIGDYLTEINITSPTCLQEIDRIEGDTGEKKLARLLLNEIKKS